MKLYYNIYNLQDYKHHGVVGSVCGYGCSLGNRKASGIGIIKFRTFEQTYLLGYIRMAVEIPLQTLHIFGIV